ncbi:MAG: flagellar type secretion system protein FlhB [Pseudomonadota bacterium]|jgi:flagellar biosynthetic protein FlhB
MAEESDLEKTEEASPRRLEKAREEGDIPRSKELSTFAGLMAAALGLWLTGSQIVTQLQNIIKSGLDFDHQLIENTASTTSVDFSSEIINLAINFLPFFMIVMLIGILSPVLVGGWIFNSKAMEPKLDKLDPIKGFGNIISKNSLVELLKSILKTILIGTVSWFVTKSMIYDILALSIQPFRIASHNQGQILLICFITISAAFAIIAMLDAPYQLHRYGKKLMMTRQDLKDEAKESEGNPETKAKIRSIQREMARKRMMAEVPKADVVIINPTHYAVALSYPEDSDFAPIVVAKGLGEVALKIQEIAKDHRIMVVEAPMLARALYTHANLDQEIPTTLFTAVAQVLAYVFQMRDWKNMGGDEPIFPDQINVPKELDPLNGSQP